jgi:hypothetical protein
MWSFDKRTIRIAASAAALGAAASLLAACGGGGGSSLAPAIGQSSAAGSSNATVVQPDKVSYTTLDDAADPTFNQLLGINTKNVIAGYYGSGADAKHPNKGYTLVPPYGQSNYTNENYPGSVQTQVTGITNGGVTCGFGVGVKGKSFGWVNKGGNFVQFQHLTQILGCNDSGTAVGFAMKGKKTFGYTLDEATGKLTQITPPGGKNVTVAGINSRGDITGFYSAGKATDSFIYKSGAFTIISYPGSTNTVALGINVHDEVVGDYVDSSGAMHGFTVTTPVKGPTYKSYDAPNGVGMTTFNGLNDKGVIVGFYTDGNNLTHGLLVKGAK